MERRSLLRAAVLVGTSAALGGTLWRGAAYAAPAQPGTGPYGPLGSPDANGIRLPGGFTSRVIARSGQRVGSTSYTWHNAPDGGACYADGTGWIYVSNSEINPSGGASAVRFSSTGAITGAYRLLSGTRQNCAGGKMPSGSEITGPAFSPDGTRLYFSSQRGTSGSSSGGITYEVKGPFRA